MSGMPTSPEKAVIWLHGEVKSPPFTLEGRQQAGHLLRDLQSGESLSLPRSRPMPSIGSRCHELRITDERGEWRIIYRIDADAILILDVFSKKTRATPRHVIDACRKRIARYDDDSQDE